MKLSDEAACWKVDRTAETVMLSEKRCSLPGNRVRDWEELEAVPWLQ